MSSDKATNALYADLSAYYDVMCADIDYLAQSRCIRRLHQLLGNGGTDHLDLACGTAPHIRHFIDMGYTCTGLDINRPMLDIAKRRSPEAEFTLQNMCEFQTRGSFDVITCFLYSIHYSEGIDKLQACILSAHAALNEHGILCFNAVDKHKIDNSLYARHTAEHEGSHFEFSSRWHYCGRGERQSLKLSIDRTAQNISHTWQDEHSMVAVSFEELKKLLQPYFDVHILEHDYEKLVPWDGKSGNAIFACVKI